MPSTTAASPDHSPRCPFPYQEDDDATHIHFGENALYHLVSEGVVVRVARTLDYWADVVNEVNVSRWLAQQGMPAAEVYDTAQPLDVSGCPVTFWRFIPGRAGGPDDISTLGMVLRQLHALPKPTTFELPHEDILGKVAGRIEAAHELKMTTWRIQNVEESREIADEHHVRMRTIRHGERPSWRPF